LTIGDDGSLRVKPFPQLDGRYRTGISRSSEEPLPNFRDRIVSQISQPVRQQPAGVRQASGESARLLADVQHGGPAGKGAAIRSPDHDAVGQLTAGRRREGGKERRSAQRRESERGTGGIVVDHEADRSVAKAALSVVEEAIGLAGDRGERRGHQGGREYMGN